VNIKGLINDVEKIIGWALIIICSIVAFGIMWQKYVRWYW